MKKLILTIILSIAAVPAVLAKDPCKQTQPIYGNITYDAFIPASGAAVLLMDWDFNVVAEITADKHGRYKFGDLSPCRDYIVRPLYKLPYRMRVVYAGDFDGSGVELNFWTQRWVK